ncbi:MAG: hypothetical protein EBV20_02365 [Betaproteobacteria bacterium]|jgi:TolC family type I secretion outer membrane protein|nr:hypothetical protein [Betaproteobacteria bacterium]NBP43825.1 hypothetical protein [Betaproteobacteria bacterium]
MKAHKQTLLVLAMSLAFASSNGWAGGLRTELQHLRNTHPLLRASDYAIAASEQRREAATYGGYLPKLNISADTGHEDISTTSWNTVGIVEGTATNSDLKRRKYGFTIEQNLFNGGKTLATVSLATLDEAIKKEEAKATSQDITLEAIVAYMQVLRNQLLIDLARINERTTLEQLDLEKKRVEKGGGVAVDELQAATRLQIVRERRVFYEQSMRDAAAAYEQVYGKKPDFIGLEDLDSYTKLLPADVDAALAFGVGANPRMVVTKLQSAKAQKMIAMEQAGLFPNLDLAMTHNRERNVGGQAYKSEDSVLLRMSWNLFSGGETLKRSSAARLEHKEALEREIGALRKTSESVRMAWNQYEKGNERLNLLEQATQTSKGVMEGRKKMRDAGKETALAVLDAEVEYFGVLSNKVNAMIDARLGSYRLLHALGMLDMNAFNLDTEPFELPVRPFDDSIRNLVSQ